MVQRILINRGKCVLIALVLLAVLAAVLPALAQSTDVTDDQVNAIAKKLYCPVCENITLDTCGTAACADWRYEIQLQLEAGKNEQEIIDDFVVRFGDRVVGTPQNPALRALSLVTPWILIGLGVVGAAVFLIRRPRAAQSPAQTPAPAAGGSRYQDLLEQDIVG